MQIVTIPIFYEEKILFIREYKNGSYSIISYIISNTLICIPFLFIIVIANSLFLFFIVPYMVFGNFVLFCVIYFLCLFISESIAVFICFVFEDVITSIGFFCIINSLLVFINSHSIKKFNLKSFWYFASFFNYFKYAYETVVFLNFKDLFFYCDQIGEECFCFYKRENIDFCRLSGMDVLKNFWLEDVNVTAWIFILCFIVVLLRVCLFFYLKYFAFRYK